MNQADALSASGLSELEAAARLRAEGPNELPATEQRTAFVVIREVMSEPMLALLLAGGLLYLALGDLKEGLILLAFGLLSIVITTMQETRTERVLRSLRALSSPRALVIRDGRRRRIAGTEVVRGDIVVLGEGERVPADAKVVEAHDLMVDESLLTGESLPVRKSVWRRQPHSLSLRPGGEDLPYVFSGSLVVRGTALTEVTATGPRSAIGRIGVSLGEVEREPPRLHRETSRIVRVLAVLAAAISLLAIVLYAWTRGDWLQGVLAGIAIGMSMLPSELPVILTVFMAMGAWRISRAKVLTRRLAAIETLGSATVLCTDKTGTLTENAMTLAELVLPDGRRAAPFPVADAACEALLQAAVLSSARNAADPMEQAIHAAGAALPPAPPMTLVHAFGLRPDLLAVTHLWRVVNAPDIVVAAKGAPEAIAGLCKLSDAERDGLRAAVDAMGQDGRRVLGVARGQWGASRLPDSPRSIGFEFLGLVALADPLRANVPEAVGDCRSAGIRVVMITGDYPATAASIARQAGIDARAVVSGADLEHMDDSAVAEAVARASVFARVMPDQKLRIVQALKSAGEVVGMTGDGVNDAPSLKAAHIGIAMGGRGTDVAREASSIVLLDDNFPSIVDAVRLGRRIYDNLRKATAFIFAVHVPIAGLALLPLIAGLPPLLGPVHIVFLQLIIDPVCSLVFEAELAERDVMRRPPRSPREPLFSRTLVGWGLIQGALALTVVGVAFAVASHRRLPESEMRALCFFALVASVVVLIFANRSFGVSLAESLGRPNPMLVAVLAVVGAILAASLLLPSVADLFRFGPLHADDLAVVAATAGLLFVVLTVIKSLLRARRGSKQASRRRAL